MVEKRNPKKSSSSLTGGFSFHFLFFFPPSQHTSRSNHGPTDADSLCKLHLNAGKQHTNKGTTDKLEVMGPLIPSISTVCLFRQYILPKDQTITMNTEATYYKVGDRPCASPSRVSDRR